MFEPNIMVEWLAVSFYIQKVCGTHLRSGMRCADYVFYFIFFSPSGHARIVPQIKQQTLPHPFQLIH